DGLAIRPTPGGQRPRMMIASAAPAGYDNSQSAGFRPPADLRSLPAMRRLAALLLLPLCASVTSAEDWPGWRGPRGDGTSTETGVPIKWTRTDNVAWKTEIPGIGHSSPVVWGDSVFVTSCLETGDKKGKRVLIRLDRRDGKVLWERTVVDAPLEHKHG